MTAPRLEKLRHFIHEVDRLHANTTRPPRCLTPWRSGWRRWCVTTTGCRKSTPLPHPHHYQQYLLHADSGSASRLSASSGDGASDADP